MTMPDTELKAIAAQFEAGAYFVRCEEMRGIAEPIIARHHRHLEQCSIAYLMAKDIKPVKGKTVAAKAMKAPGMQRVLHGFDFVIVADFGLWMHLEEAQKKALIDHELCHCGIDDKDRPTIIGHDLEEFTAIVKRHGFWEGGLERFVRQVEETQLQLSYGAKPGEVIDKRTGEVREGGNDDAVD